MSDVPPGGADRLLRFLLPAAGVRGVHVRLEDTWRQIRARAAYPDAIARLLGETCVAAALFTGHTKVDGRLTIQLRGNGHLRSLFAECTALGTLRGLARWDEHAPPPLGLRELGPEPLLAITIENPAPAGREPQRYQGLVRLDADRLAEACEGYFRQSEQLPTRLLLAADADRAAGLMLQRLPGDGGDADGWLRAGALFETLAEPELLTAPGDVLIHRLFHEEAPERMAVRPLRFGCSCSRERVAAMLQSLGRAEAMAAASGGEAVIDCEFCGQSYRFTRAEVDALFRQPPGLVAAPEGLQ